MANHTQITPTTSRETVGYPKTTGGTVTRTTPRAVISPAAAKVLAVLRVAVGFTFLWAFLDKLAGLNYATGSGKGWLSGGSPTKGFLSGVEVGPFQSIFHSFAGAGWANWLFMLGLLGIGVALIAGVAMRIAAVSGALLLVFMFLASWPLAQFDSSGVATHSTNPLFDDHLITAVVLVVLALTSAGTTWGLGKTWARLPFVTAHNWAR